MGRFLLWRLCRVVANWLEFQAEKAQRRISIAALGVGEESAGPPRAAKWLLASYLVL